MGKEQYIIEEKKLKNEEGLYIGGKTLNNLEGIYIKEKKLKKAEGIIKYISKYELSYSANTNKGSSGSPIFLKNNINVIGIHKAGVGTIENIGDFIYPVINLIKEDIRKIRNNGKYINGKYIYGDCKYYIGEYKNNIPNGKGIKYYKNGNIL